MNLQKNYKQCLIEIAHQISDPESGISKNMIPPLITLSSWRQCMMSEKIEGWVSCGVRDDIAEVVHTLGLGQVIASVDPDLSIYDNSIAPRFIYKSLTRDTDEEKNNYRLIANHTSFVRIAEIVKDMVPDDLREEYCKDMTRWLKQIVPRVFWIMIRVPEDVANELKSINIGEIIPASGNTDYIKDYNKPLDSLPICRWMDEELENVDMIPADQKKSEIKDNSDKNYPFRLVMNQRTAFDIIIKALQIKNVRLDSNIKVFEELGGKDNLSYLFSKMSI